jgi:hypothetical protein
LAASRAAGEAIHVVTEPSSGCHSVMLPSATIFLILICYADFLAQCGSIE